jgi:hypothetical protein
MTTSDPLPNVAHADLDDLLNDHFAGKVVRKDLTKLVKEGANVPVYVLEYLLGTYCASRDEATIAEGLQTVKKVLAENYVRPDEAEKVKSTIRERGRLKVIDKVTVKLNEKRDVYEALLSNLGVKNAEISDSYVRQFEKLLVGGQNTLEVVISPIAPINNSLAALALVALPEAHRVFVRKPAFHFGWDWGPKLTAGGITGRVFLRPTEQARIQNWQYELRSLTDSMATLAVTVELHAASPQLHLRALLFNEEQLVYASPGDLTLEQNHARFTIRIPQPRLWWPNGSGEAAFVRLDRSSESGRAPIGSLVRIDVPTTLAGLHARMARRFCCLMPSVSSTQRRQFDSTLIRSQKKWPGVR